MNDGAKIVLLDEDGEEIEFYVVEETRINNIDYLLVAESDDDEAEAYILKDLSDPLDPDASYAFVEDEEEIAYIGKIFEELLEENDIGLE